MGFQERVENHRAKHAKFFVFCTVLILRTKRFGLAFIALHVVTSSSLNPSDFVKEIKTESGLENPKNKRQTKCVSMISLSFSYFSAMQICAGFYLFVASLIVLWELRVFVA